MEPLHVETIWEIEEAELPREREDEHYQQDQMEAHHSLVDVYFVILWDASELEQSKQEHAVYHQ